MIKLELNSTDELALRHIGKALTAMASEIESEHLRVKETNFILATGDKDSVKTERLEKIPVSVDDENVPTEKFNEMLDEEYNDPLDSNGLPWDGRIHSSSKAKIKDGSWKKRKGVDAETLATVEAELRVLMAIPVEVSKTQDSPEAIEELERQVDEEEIRQLEERKVEFTAEETEELAVQGAHVPEVGNAYQMTTTPPPPPVNHESIVSADPAIGVVVVPKHQDATPPPPPVVDAPAGCTPDAVEAVNFVEITRFITGTMVKERGWKIPEVNAKLTEQYGVTFQTLKAREDLYGTVLNFLKEQPSK